MHRDLFPHTVQNFYRDKGERMRIQYICLILLVASTVRGLPAPLGEEPRTNSVWGEWSTWSLCSRSCGSGISSQQRYCISNCKHEELEKRYQSCCIGDCPTDSLDFLQQQCLDHGNLTLDDSEGNEDCSLYCQDRLSDPPRTRKLLIDAAPGTPCRTGLGGKGVCLGGNQCAVIGCDGVLGSRRIEDKCLRCSSGDEARSSTTCGSHVGTNVYPTSLHSGIVPLFFLPQGATSIHISHPLEQHQGRLTVKLPSNEYAFEVGNNDTKFEVSGVTFLYQILRNGDGFTEHITSRGPLVQKLKVELRGIAMDATPEASYEYYQLSAADTSDSPVAETNTHRSTPVVDTNAVLVWKHTALSECSLTCGHGLRTLVPKCVDVEYPERRWMDARCIHHPKPLPLVQSCQLQTCPPSWVPGNWMSCSEQCAGGLQTRHVECRQSGSGPVATNSSLCDEASRPVEARQCNVQECRFTWVPGDWSECSEDTYEGLQYRTLECHDRVSGLVVDPSYCGADNKPDTVKICRMANCEDGKCYKWVPRKWKRCNESCGYGYQTRNVFCVTITGTRMKVNESFCTGLERPALVQDCYDTRYPTCTPLWQAGDYGEQCVGDCCTQQYQYRRVQCVVHRARDERIVFPDEVCDGTVKPSARRPCRREDCPNWQPHPWRECPAAECEGLTLQTRVVQCVRGEEVLENTQCCSTNKPTEAQLCPVVPCPPTTSPLCPPNDSPYVPPDFCRNQAALGHCEGVNDYYKQFCTKTCCEAMSR